MNNSKKTLLLVEDEALIAMAQQRTLRNFGYEVITALRGEDAILQIRENPAIDLVLTDIDLGEGISGTEAAASILSVRDIPVVFLSSHTEPEIVSKTEGITSYGYIVKNSGGTVLDASIKMAFRLHDARQREKAHEAALERKLRYEELLSSIATMAVYNANRDEFLIQTLQLLGTKLHVSRTYIFHYDAVTNTLNNLFEWCAPDISPQLHNQQNLDAAIFAHHLDNMRQGRSVIVYDTSTLEDSPLKELILSQEILSLQLVPIFVHGNHYGFLGFDECRTQREWPDADKGLLKSIARLLSGVIERDLSQKKLAEREQQLQNLSDNIPDGMVYQIEVHPSGQPRFFTFISRSVRQLHQLEPEAVLADPMKLYNQILPDDARAMQEAEMTALRTMSSFRMVASFKLPDGSIRQRLLSSAPRYASNGSVIWDGVEVDIGERPYK